MKKYKYILIIALTILIFPNIVNAVTAGEACKAPKKNGDSCKYDFKGTFGTTELRQGRCDRWDDGRLYCNARDPKGWTDCFNKSQPNDACLRSGDRKGTCQKVANDGNKIDCILDVPSQARDEWEACKGNEFYNGASCTYTTLTTVGGNPVTKTEKSFCDRAGGISGDQFVCNKDVNGWKGCYKLGDACMLNNQLGVCKGDKPEDCDTNKTPPGNPGGSTPATCGGKTCDSTTEVCAILGGSPTCTKKGDCSGKTCDSTTEVCAILGGSPTCTKNASTPGTPANNGTNPDATSPQTVSFINPSRFNSIIDLVAGVINALLGILGAITVGVLVKSGFEYMISSDPGAVGKALDGIKNAIVGLMIIMGAFLITQYVISALAGSSTAPPPPNSPPDNSNQNPPKPTPTPTPKPTPTPTPTPTPKPTPTPTPKPTPTPTPKPAPKPPGTCGGKTCKPNEGCLEDASGKQTCISCAFLGC